ncbi:M16 family metallopeptidase [Shewanella sp. YLB-07]|uniref:M16 family metallopeptidase n=1 Tax=Shewanella sp. YLB-07 TaxID=2601268 RepID=UPI00128E4E7F|nr:pitrilysin family protein [Shewanella sp. YLB-07]MPY22915.1 insulinase family protein [Shewanella sp. YLB-07]
MKTEFSLKYCLLAYSLCLYAFISPNTLAEELNLEQLAAPLYHLEQKISYQTLDNGLQIRLLPMDNTLSVSIASQFSVGSRDEAPGQTGYAHLFEHMLFKGSKNAPGDSYAQTMSSLSGQFNASTFFDFTNYYLTIPSAALELALWLEADRFIRPALTQETVTNQQATVLEEMATSIDNQPYVRQAMEFLLKQAQGTPYQHAVIGSKQDIAQSTPTSLNQFHQNHYRPDAMQLSIVGGLPPQTTEWIQSLFGDWAKASTPINAHQEYIFDNKSVRAEIVDNRGPWPALLLAWHTVGQANRDAAAVTLLEGYLFQNRNSIIKQSGLKDPEQLLTYSIPLSMEHMGVTNLVIVPRAKTSLDKLAGNIEQMINQLSSQGISESDLDHLKAEWLNLKLRQVDSPSALARALSATLPQDRLVPLTGPWERINAVTTADMQRVAGRYFNHGYVRLDLLPPWYIRWGKTLLEWLPGGLTDSLEDSVL